MLTKEQVISSLNDLPEKFSMDELIDKLILFQKIETGLEQSKKEDFFYGGRSETNAETKVKVN